MTFDVEEHHVEFGLFNDEKPSSTVAYCGCEIIDSSETMDLLDTNLSALPIFLVLYLRVLDLMMTG